MSAIRVLIVERDLAEAQFLEEAVLEIAEFQPHGPWPGLQVFHASAIAPAITQIQSEELDAVLLNLNLEDSSGLDTYRTLKAYGPDLPFILIVDRAEDLDTARKGLREGAQDYLLRSEIDYKPLGHAIEAAIERSRLIRALWNAFQFDEYTGLPNRSGFLYLAELIRTLLTRLEKPMRLILAEVEQSRVPERATAPGAFSREPDVLEAADALRTCMDDGDLLGRVSPRRFCVLSPSSTATALRERIVQASPPGQRPRLRWSELETSPASGQAIEILLASAEQCLSEDAWALSVVN
jgi:DNA-binding NarL/FixJ family response regulator